MTRKQFNPSLDETTYAQLHKLVQDLQLRPKELITYLVNLHNISAIDLVIRWLNRSIASMESSKKLELLTKLRGLLDTHDRDEHD